jgi:UDP-glucose 4-epimerase
MHVLVTGGAGFIGSNIVEALVARGERVRVLDNFATGKRENLAEVIDRIELVEGDLREFESVYTAARGVDVILHQGALPSVPRSVQHPGETNAVNVTGTLNVLMAARDLDVKRVVLASSSSVYGNTPTLPKEETMAPNPMSPYAISKLAGEMYARAFAQLYGLSTVCLRYFQVFGPRQDPTSQYSAVIPRFIQRALRGEPFPIDGDGDQTRDFTFIENVVRANLRSAEIETEGGLVMNIASASPISINGLAALLNELTGQQLASIHGPARPGDVRDSFAAIGRARELLGYQAWVNFRDGLEKTLKWYASRKRDE